MRGEDQPLKNIAPKELLANAGELHKQGCRIVQICCTKLAGNKFELTYSFDRDYRYTSLRVTVSSESEVPSITSVYGGAYLYENEIRELFGVKFKGINVDYNGHLYKKKAEAPFAIASNKEDAQCQKE
jgi:ech hydrogenase subunit D